MICVLVFIQDYTAERNYGLSAADSTRWAHFSAWGSQTLFCYMFIRIFFFLSIKRGHFHNSFFFYSPVKELCLKQTLSVNRCAVEGGTGKPIFHQKYFPRKCLIIPKFTTTLNLVQRHKETANRESALLGTVPQRAAIPPWFTCSMCRMGKPTRISFGRGHIVLPSFLYPQGTHSLTIC